MSRIVKYYALFANITDGTKGFRFIGAEYEGDPKPEMTDGDILIMDETQLNTTRDILTEHGEEDDFFLFEIEGTENRASGACQVVYLGKFTNNKQLNKAAQSAVCYPSHWVVDVFNYREISEIFQKLEPRCGKFH